jgi:hypothetical protein
MTLASTTGWRVTGGVNAEVCAAELKRFFEALRARGEK